jgi:hypothetical protein
MATEQDRDPALAEAIAQLRDTQPEVDLWPGIARQLPRHPRGTVILHWPMALAAGLAIVIVSAAGTAVVLHRTTVAAPAVAAIANPDHAAVVPASYSPDDAALARAVNDVEQLVRASYPEMNPSARNSVQQSLAALDQAIAQASQRERAAPDDPRAAKYLTGALRKKLQVLRTVHTLTQRS